MGSLQLVQGKLLKFTSRRVLLGGRLYLLTVKYCEFDARKLTGKICEIVAHERTDNYFAYQLFYNVYNQNVDL